MELHVYYSEPKLLRVAWGQSITLDSLRRHFDLLIANDHYPRRLRVISSADIEELGFALTHANMLLIKGWRDDALRRYESVTTALYNLKPVPSAYISYFSEFFDSPKSRLKQFATEQAALHWLRHDSLGHDVACPN